MADDETTLREIKVIVEQTGRDMAELAAQFKILNGTVRSNCTDIAVLKDWRTQASPKIEGLAKETVDLRVEIVKAAASATTIGLIIAAIMFGGKLLGLF